MDKRRNKTAVNVAPSQRITEFGTDTFCVQGSLLWCKVCASRSTADGLTTYDRRSVSQSMLNGKLRWMPALRVLHLNARLLLLALTIQRPQHDSISSEGKTHTGSGGSIHVSQHSTGQVG